MKILDELNVFCIQTNRLQVFKYIFLNFVNNRDFLIVFLTSISVNLFLILISFYLSLQLFSQILYSTFRFLKIND